MMKDKKKIIIIMSVILSIWLGISIVLYIASMTRTFSIHIDDVPFLPTFKEDVYDYYILTEQTSLNFQCKGHKKGKISGCNQRIDISNYSNYIHEIIVDSANQKEIYKFYIKVKTADHEKNIVINSVDGVNEDWTDKNQVISINASSENAIKEYSIDNGLTFQKSSLFTIAGNRNLSIVVKDVYDNLTAVRQETVNNIDKESPEGFIVKKKVSNKSITLQVFAKDEHSGINSYSWNGGKYGKKSTYRITKKGVYNVKIKDNAGNVSERDITIKDSDFGSKEQLVATFYRNGSNRISYALVACNVTDGKCKITLPDIFRDDSQIIGWSTDKNAKSATYLPGDKITLSKDMTFYAITAKEVTANFHDGDDITVENCTIYNDEKFCYVKVPTINSDNKILGWNVSSDSHVVLESPNCLAKVYDDVDYYSLAFEELTAKFESNGADSLSYSSDTCSLDGDEETCHVTAPEIKREGYDIVGWSLNKNATQSDVLEFDDITISDDVTYYAITRKEVTVDFLANGSDSSTAAIKKCSIYNRNTTCNVTTPVINRPNANVLGWSLNQNDHSANILENATLPVDKNVQYYAITSKKNIASFHENGATKLSSSQEECTSFNDGGCTIKTPDIIRSSWNVLGWNTKSNASVGKVKVKSDLTIKDDVDYFAITSKTFTAKFNKNNADYLGNCSKQVGDSCLATCNVYNLKESCSVDVPYIYSRGNEVHFFSTSDNPKTTIGYSPALKLDLFSDLTLNAIVDNRHHQSTYSIVKSQNYGYTAFETESGCPSSVYQHFYSFLDKIYGQIPYIFRAAKVTFASANSFNETWGNYAGMTYGIAEGYRSIDLKCPSTYSSYYVHTLVHELTHSWDGYYKAIHGTAMSKSSDFEKLYAKYINSEKRPLRDYSYTNVSEFVADVYAWYYFLYIDTSDTPSVVLQNPYYPNDMKRVMEKYIKIAIDEYE